MSWDINSVTLIGRLSSDVDLKYTPNGAAVAKFGLAVGGKPKPDGGESVSFFNVVIWGKGAENCSQYLKKGNQIALDGRLEQRSWAAQDGSKRSTVEIIAERVEFLNTKNSAAAPAKNSKPAQSGGGFDDSFYDNTNFDPTPVDPSAFDPDNPNF